jgi:hypothetical protein
LHEDFPTRREKREGKAEENLNAHGVKRRGKSAIFKI